MCDYTKSHLYFRLGVHIFGRRYRGMAYRDRTALFLRYRAEARNLHSRPISSNGVPPRISSADEDDDDGNDDTRLLSPGKYNNLDVSAAHSELKEDVRASRQLLRELRDSYATHLLPRFGDDTDGCEGSNPHSAIETNIREKAGNLTNRLHSAQSRVRALNGTTTIEKNLQRRFASELQEISNEAKKRQKDYLTSLQNQRNILLIQQEQGSRNDKFGKFDKYSLEDDMEDQEQLSVSDTRHLEAETQRRETELRAVSSSITELATLVKDLASLVVDQGTLLDRIDYNLEDTAVSTHAAVRELRTADAYSRKRQAFCLIIILSIACGILSIMLVFKWTT